MLRRLIERFLFMCSCRRSASETHIQRRWTTVVLAFCARPGRVIVVRHVKNTSSVFYQRGGWSFTALGGTSSWEFIRLLFQLVNCCGCVTLRCQINTIIICFVCAAWRWLQRMDTKTTVAGGGKLLARTPVSLTNTLATTVDGGQDYIHNAQTQENHEHSERTIVAPRVRSESKTVCQARLITELHIIRCTCLSSYFTRLQVYNSYCLFK